MKVNANLKPNDDSFKIGQVAEDLFQISCWKKGYNVTKSSRSKDMFDHIDYYVKTKGGELRSFDVKSRKRTKRGDKNFNDDWIWIEFKNVNGKNGWLYGKADYIAFERKDSFLIVQRKELAGLCEKRVDLETKVKNANQARYKSYTSWQRKDVLSQIKTEDIIKNTKTWVWGV